MTRVEAPAGAPPIVILGGFGNNSQDYSAPFGDPDVSLVSSLRNRGWDVEVVQLERRDWAKILRGVFSLGFWTSKATTEPGYTWYLELVDEAVNRALERCGDGQTQVDIIAHSAGGWLARAYIGGALNEVDFTKTFRFFAKEEQRNENFESISFQKKVRHLVTLGAPHRVASVPGANDATRGALAWVDERWPGARFKDEGVTYTCVVGKTVRGRGGAEFKKTLAGYANGSYEQVCGEGDMIVGDAVVPCEYAVLDGAENIVLEGVFHSMSKVGTYDEDSKEVWYGSDEVLDCFLRRLV
jgi:pimeloyl-ACP methyl ester carboxylesterase